MNELVPSDEMRPGDDFLVVLQEVAARFGADATRPRELPALAELARLVDNHAPLDAIAATFRRLAFDGYLRGAMTTVAESMLASPRGELGLLLARELVDAIDPPLGLALARAALTLPAVVNKRHEIGSVYARLHLLVADTLMERGDLAQARRYFEAVLALDIDHSQAAHEYQNYLRRLEARGVETRHQSRGLALLDGLDEVELERNLAGGRYELGRPLGRGRHAVVYEAFDRHVGRHVALKRLLGTKGPRGRASLRVIEQRFFAEARTLAKVRSPYVVALLDAQPQHHFVALDLCRGGNLRSALRRGQVDGASLTRVADQLHRALNAVHAAGAVHRDVKPANILVRDTQPESPIALADFGLALDPNPGRVDVAGTLRYLAPEVRRGEAPSPASDHFGAGVVLLEIALCPEPLPAAFDLLDATGDDLTTALPRTLSPASRRMITGLLDPDPSQRKWS
ncbi:MAG: serine/threonine protein kinase [Myxococcales bacterium FL481]|nr:MAG: serine/threonine protein kinase [Myxococcales bacterium FL481]